MNAVEPGPEARALFAAARRLMPLDRRMEGIPDHQAINLGTSAGAVRDLVRALTAAERVWPKVKSIQVEAAALGTGSAPAEPAADRDGGGGE